MKPRKGEKWGAFLKRQAIAKREKERRIAAKSNPLMPRGEIWLPFNGDFPKAYPEQKVHNHNDGVFEF